MTGKIGRILKKSRRKKTVTNIISTRLIREKPLDIYSIELRNKNGKMDTQNKTPSNILDPLFLSLEAEFFYEALFHKKIPSSIRNRYIEAHKACDLNHGFMQSSLKIIVSKRLDIQAIELCSRNSSSVLTKKVHLLVYLMEVTPQYYSIFINEKSCRIKAFFILTFSVFQSAWKWTKGHYLIWMYHLV